jgi:hypothetical protein
MTATTAARPARGRCQPRAAFLALCCALLLASEARADLIVPTGGVVSLAAGGVDLGCTDLVIGGTLQANAAPVLNVRNVVVQAGGTLDAGSGVTNVGGSWTVTGTFIAGSGTVNFVDGCGGAGALGGDTTFNQVSFASATGKSWTFAAGSTQTIEQLLSIQGTPANPVQLRSSALGQPAFIKLNGGQNIAHVGVTDLTATGAWLAPGQSNEGGGGRAIRWFGVPTVAAIPALGTAGRVALLVLLAGAAARRLRRRG